MSAVIVDKRGMTLVTYRKNNNFIRVNGVNYTYDHTDAGFDVYHNITLNDPIIVNNRVLSIPVVVQVGRRNTPVDEFKKMWTQWDTGVQLPPRKTCSEQTGCRVLIDVVKRGANNQVEHEKDVLQECKESELSCDEEDDEEKNTDISDD